MIKEINNIKAEIENYSGSSSKEIEIFRIKYVSKKSIVNDLFLQFKNMDSNKKKVIGKLLNELKTIAKSKLIKLSNNKDANKNLSNDDIDLFLPPQNDTVGSLHPLRIIRNKIIKIFRDIGFTIESGPEIEDDWYNFTALKSASISLKIILLEKCKIRFSFPKIQTKFYVLTHLMYR